MFNNNLGNWLRGSAKDRERREMRRRWSDVEDLWQESPPATRPLADFAADIVVAAANRYRTWPSTRLLAEVCVATEALLADEDITPIEPRWSIIDNDVEVAVDVRALLTRRRRWAANFNRMYGVFERQVLDGYDRLFRMLPRSCFGPWPEDGWAMGVPLVELLEEPAEFIQELILLPFDDETLENEIFRAYRIQLTTNLLVASGFAPEDDPNERVNRFVYPPAQRNKSPAELSRLYLAHTPFEELMELPVPLEIPEEIRCEHCHIIGGTGHGKTQLLQRLIHDDLVLAQNERRAVVVIDSQGDLLGKLRRLEVFSPEVEQSLADRLVVIDPADVEFPPALNLFDAHLERLDGYRLVDRERVLNGVVELYETFFGDLLGAELTQKQGVVFKYLARLMLTIPDATIYTLMQLMEDGGRFKPYMAKLDGSARHFFQKEFFDPSFISTKKQILKRLWGVLSTPAFERMFAQPTNKLDLFQALQDGKIVLISTAKDLLKREGSQLFGRFFIAMLTQAALERSTVPEDERTPAMVYVDEAQEYFSDDIETLLNQARKYRVGLTLAHQALDQLSPRLRSILHTNTSMKCVGGVSSKDARGFADDLQVTADFIESMKRRPDRTEFAAYLKHHTPRAVRLSVPLGFLERQPTLTEEAYDLLVEKNRVQYCGTLADVQTLAQTWHAEPEDASPPSGPPTRRPKSDDVAGRPLPDPPAVDTPFADTTPTAARTRPPRDGELGGGKGGPRHQYLQAYVKELAELQGFRATIEGAVNGGQGQVDVLLERKDLTVAVEVSVTTPPEHERENLRKCLAAGYEHVVLVLAKSQRAQGRHGVVVLEGLSAEERARVTVLKPEEVPDFIAALAPPMDPSETTVRGYRVKVAQKPVTPKEALERRAQIARVVAQSLRES